jgi:hypothetical protein
MSPRHPAAGASRTQAGPLLTQYVHSKANVTSHFVSRDHMFSVVRRRGLEPLRFYPLAPQASATGVIITVSTVTTRQGPFRNVGNSHHPTRDCTVSAQYAGLRSLLGGGSR